MGHISQKILDGALKLPAAQRAALASSLIASIEEAKVDPDAECAWTEEIARRIRKIDSGRARLIPWSEVRRGILARIHAERHARVGRRSPRRG